MERTLKRSFLTYKIDHGAAWLLVFRHRTSYKFFDNKTQAEFNLEENLFSIISFLSDSVVVRRYTNDCYEFLLEYPDDYPGEYNRWKQSKNPMFDLETSDDGKKNATGYHEVHIDWDSMYWGGLMKSSAGQTLLDGSTYHYYWHYAIGDISKDFGQKTPGPEKTVSFVQLWIRIKTATGNKMKRESPFFLFIF